MTYKEIFLETPNKKKGAVIIPTGILLHDTEWFNLQGCIDIFQDPASFASAHLLIDLDGTRYIFGKDNEKLYHAGHSIFNGRKWCNNFMLGVEFLGDTRKKPLTDDQIKSFVEEWAKPRIEKYNFINAVITDHKKVRTDYINQFGDNGGKIKAKRDIEQPEFDRIMKILF